MKLWTGKVNGVLDLLVTSPQELSRRCGLPPLEIKAITELACKGFAPEAQTLGEWISYRGDAQGWVTTGDQTLDRVLGGGVRTGMVWEFVGERSVFRRSSGSECAVLNTSI